MAEPVTAFPLPRPEHEAPLPAARIGAGGVRVFSGVPYAALPGSRSLELDLFLPPSEGLHPLVVFLHGGGWRAGSRRSAGPVFAGVAPSPFERVAMAGVAVASVDYRLSGEARWPAQLHDVKAAVRWIRSRASELDIDGDRIAAWGESAGGHLAALLGLTPDSPELAGSVGLTGVSSGVSAGVAWYAPTDLVALPGDNGQDARDPATREAQLLGAPLADVPGLAAQASSVTYAAAGAPPFLLLHGSADRLIACRQSERLHDALERNACDVRLHIYDGADHMWLGRPDVAADALDRTVAFLVGSVEGSNDLEPAGRS